ncbi:MAG: signal peptide peptidase SppA [Planctomycetaceae bacterium]|nr:signal peptide peptidase SppA [Planctomycetaceae bacterium]
MSVSTMAADEKADEKQTRKTRTDWADIELTGSYPESHQLPGLFGDLTESLPTCLDRLAQAARDRSIKGVLLRIDGVSVGWARLHEIRRGIQAIQAEGKPVWAILNDADTKEYLLASGCDRVIISEPATLMLTGLRAEVMFYRNLFELLDVKADMLRVGAFKSAAEPYTRTEMSDEFRLQMEELLDDHFDALVAKIAEGRKRSPEEVEAAIDEGLLPASHAKELGLVDDIAYADQLVSLIQGDDESLDVRIREDYRKHKPNTELDLFTLMQLLAGPQQSGQTGPRIAVIRAEGMIVTGSVPTGLFGEASISSDKFVPLITKLGKDDNVKAIVLRVDSPGGSALASDLIWRALEATGKPIVASMGDTAASGGYYISMGADRIFADEGTLTGSIGVVGGKISFEGLMNKVGVTTTVIRRGQNAGILSVTSAFTDSERNAMQRMLDHIYQQFTTKAADGRGMEHGALEKLARGRVYTGRQAKELGLVDELGSLNDAIAHARKLAGDTEGKLDLDELPRPISPLEMLMGQRESVSPVPSVIAAVLPESMHRLMHHWIGLRQLSEEPTLLVLPYAVTID